MKSFALGLLGLTAFALFHHAMRADQRALCSRSDEVRCPAPSALGEVAQWLK